MSAMKRRVIVFLTILTSAIYILWRLTRTLPFHFGWFSMVCGLTLVIVELIGFFEMVVHFNQLSNPLILEEIPEVNGADFPHVDILISTYNEPTDLLYKTINACLHMDYPDLSKVHIYLCDDGNREEMGVLARELGVTHLVRNTHRHAKAGNLNHALSVTNSPLIVTFDADMMPRKHFLMRTIPYFMTEKIGFIQTPQTFYNPDLFQYNLYSEKNAPNEQDYFYRDVQVMRNASNSVIYGGTNTILSREALEAAGGFFTGVITEDFATGMMIQSKGYQCYAIDEPLAVGLAPEDLKSLINQRQRWARGCIQTGLKIKLLTVEGLSWAQKVSYLTSITYWFGAVKRFAYIMAPLLYAIFGVIVVKTTSLEVLIFWLPMYLLNNYTLRKLSGNIRNTRLTNIYETILFPSLFPVVFLELFGITQTQFKVTKKDGKQKLDTQDRLYKFKAALPHLIFVILSVVGIVISVYQTFNLGTPAYVIIVFWLTINLYNLTMSLFFMIGRQANRRHERFAVEVDCVLRFNDRMIRTKTLDISEGGISIQLPFPEWIPAEEAVDIELSTAHYQAKFTGKIANVFKFNENWRYGFALEDISPQAQQKFLQIIYDREHSLPKFIVDDYSSVQDWVTNFQIRFRRSRLFSNKLPRITLFHSIETNLGERVVLREFNYEYITLQLNKTEEEKHNIPQKMTLIENGLELHCEFVEQTDQDLVSYQVMNADELNQQPMFRLMVKSWMDRYEEEVQQLDQLKSEVGHYLEDSYVTQYHK